jgi:hypothetical protein
MIDMVKQGSGWQRVDRSTNEARERLKQASTEEQFQAIGLLCREALISLAQMLYDPTTHTPLDCVAHSRTDAKRMLEAYIAHTLLGKSNEVARRHAKAALDLANQLQHKRTASNRDAALCLEATTAVVNLMAIISEQTERAPLSSIQAEFSYRGLKYRSEEHQYLLEVRIVNPSDQTIREFRLEFFFPDLNSIPKKWIVLGSESARRLVETEPTDDAVSVSIERYMLRVTYRSKDVLFPQDELDLTEAIGLRYKFDDSVYENLGEMPPLHWILSADDMRQKQGDVPLTELNNY